MPDDKFVWTGSGANVSQCLGCRHWQGGIICDAFNAIPLEIRTNDHDHRKPYPGDNGIRFEPIEETNEKATD